MVVALNEGKYMCVLDVVYSYSMNCIIVEFDVYVHMRYCYQLFCLSESNLIVPLVAILEFVWRIGYK